MAVKHQFVSAVSDGGDTDLVQPTDWNADHSIDTEYTTTGSELAPGGDLAIDPTGAPGWTIYGVPSYTFGVGSLSWSWTSGTFAGFELPVATTSGTWYVIEIDQNLSANIGADVGFYNNTATVSPVDDQVRYIFKADYTGTDTLYMYAGVKASGHTWAITRVSVKALTANADPAITINDYSGEPVFVLGDGPGDIKIGRNAMLGRSTSGNGSSSIAIGYEALYSATTGYNNVAIGRSAMNLTSGATDTVAVGTFALSRATGTNNTAVGASAGGNITTGAKNCAVGFAGTGITTGHYNVAIGHNALCSAQLTTGYENIAIGHDPGLAITSGDNNILLGRAGKNITTGDENFIVGGSKDSPLGDQSAAATLTTGSRNIVIGRNTLDVPTAGTSDYLNIGNAIKGDMAAGPIAFQVPFSHKGVAFADKPASPVAGSMIYFTDSNTATWGATVAGGGANPVLAWYNGTNWTVVGA
jgi:hypothetical protein